MQEKGKLRLKKFYFHPVTMYLALMFITIFLSWIFSLFEMQATYNTVNANTRELEPVLVAVENLLSFDGLKFIFSDAAKNFLSFAPLGTLLMALIGLTVAEGTLTPAFDKDTTSYSITVPYEVTTVPIAATAEYSGATVTKNGPSFLSVGDNNLGTQLEFHATINYTWVIILWESSRNEN